MDKWIDIEVSWKTTTRKQNAENMFGLHSFFCVFVKFLVILFFTSDQRDKYGLPQSRVLWLAGSSSWSSPHKKVRRRVTSFWSSGLGIGWQRSRRGVSFGRMRGGWSRKLSKMSMRIKNKQLIKQIISLVGFFNFVHLIYTWITSTQLCARQRGPGCWWGSGGTQLVMGEHVVQLGRA